MRSCSDTISSFKFIGVDEDKETVGGDSVPLPIPESTY